MTLDDLTAHSLLINKRVAATIAQNNILNNNSNRRSLTKKGKIKNQLKVVSESNGKRSNSFKDKKNNKKVKTQDNPEQTDDDNNNEEEACEENEIVEEEEEGEEEEEESEKEEEEEEEEDCGNVESNESERIEVKKVDEEIENKEVTKKKRGRKRKNPINESASTEIKKKFTPNKKQDKLKAQEKANNKRNSKNSKSNTSSSSSSSSSSTTTMANKKNIEEDLIKCKNLVNELARNENCAPFIEPVDPKTYPDYYEVIKQPMDIKTIKQKVKTKQYVFIYLSLS